MARYVVSCYNCCNQHCNAPRYFSLDPVNLEVIQCSNYFREEPSYFL